MPSERVVDAIADHAKHLGSLYPLALASATKDGVSKLATGSSGCMGGGLLLGVCDRYGGKCSSRNHPQPVGKFNFTGQSLEHF